VADGQRPHDEVIVLTCPVVVGRGTRLFPVTGPDIALELVESRSVPKGVTIQVYRPSGRPRYENGPADPEHVT
jgi:dihydrofolate reductase